MFNDAGIRVYGISYDTQEQLQAFAEQYQVTYDLLSDTDSAVIREFGILNTLITPDDPEQAAGRGFFGVPFPGVYLTDENGVVTEKFFHRHYATRESAGAIRDSALGEILARHEAPAGELATDQVEISAFLSDPSLKFETQSIIYVRFELRDGLHMYGRPLPGGYIASEVTIPDTNGLRVGSVRYPQTAAREFPELGVTLNVYEGVVDVAIPVTPNADLFNPGNRDQPEELVVPVSVLFQACSETFCYTPRTDTLSLTLPVGPLLRPGAPSRR
ncbi:MAG: peroxiredoxin [Acidobacteria bacterium]|nr:peroxiredoxin [Acidobacteriota bacterium]